MADGSVVFHSDVGYDFYFVRRKEKGGYDISKIPMPRGGASHRELSDEVMIGLPRSNDDPDRIQRKVIDAYENLIFGRKP